ncbi:COQ9 family protein [Roseovarius sp.]|uniref:COQ9 family protein n=1 Tax=Roseovarius sp. TaxID=1486281 RepID=UPI003519898B
MAQDVKSRLLAAIKPHVAFDGWGPEAFAAAVQEAEIAPELARAACPRGAIDLAVAYHEAGDAAMVAALDAMDLDEMRFRDRIAAAVMARLAAVDDPELVRRGMTLFALPHHAAEGAALIWGTADRIWTTLGDSSRDVNWYTKRATLSGVYSSTVLYWLGDHSADHADTRAFLDRRIEDVMRFEKLKAGLRDNALLSGLMAGPLKLLDRVRAPETTPRTGMPGRWKGH